MGLSSLTANEFRGPSIYGHRVMAERGTGKDNAERPQASVFHQILKIRALFPSPTIDGAVIWLLLIWLQLLAPKDALWP